MVGSARHKRLSNWPVPVKTDVGQVDLVLRLSDGTSEEIPKRAGMTDRTVNNGKHMVSLSLNIYVYCRENC